MKNCAFFGHKQCPGEVRQILLEQIRILIRDEKVKRFYVGCNGGFDRIVLGCLRQLKDEFADIDYMVVLDVLQRDIKPTGYEPGETVYPEFLADVPKRFAIDRRNRWMVENADVVVVFVQRNVR